MYMHVLWILATGRPRSSCAFHYVSSRMHLDALKKPFVVDAVQLRPPPPPLFLSEAQTPPAPCKCLLTANVDRAMHCLQQAITCFVGAIVGDALAQRISAPVGAFVFDAARNVQLASFGLLIGGTTAHYWYAPRIDIHL